MHRLASSPPSFREGVQKTALELRGIRATALQFAEGARDTSRALVCLAGMGANARSFVRQRPLAREWLVLPLNTPVDTPAAADPLEYVVEAAEEFIVHERLEKPVLLGSSFGGAAATLLALRHPDKIRGLILANAALSHRLIPVAFPEFIDVLEAPEPLAWVMAPLAAEIMGGFKLDRDARQEMVRESRKFPSYELKRRLRSLIRLDLLPELKHLRVPTLWVHGTRDWLVSRKRAQAAAARIPRSRFVAIKGAGHLPYLSHCEQFNALASEFLASL